MHSAPTHHRSMSSGRLAAWARAKVLTAWLWAGLCLFGGRPGAAAASVNATLDRDTIGLGESVTLSLVFEGGSPASELQVPGVAGLQMQYAGQSSQFTIVNGQASSTLTHTYIITPTKAGEFTIPAVRVQVDRVVLSSQPLKLKVVQGNASGGTNPLDKLAFLRLIVPTNAVYVGQVFPVEIQLFCQSAQNLQLPQLNAEGFTLGKRQEPIQTRTQIGNAVYNVVIFKSTATAAKTGDLALGPATCTLDLVIPRANARRGSIFDTFEPQADLRRVTLTSGPQTMRVLPLPAENVPPGFNGAIGNFSLSVTAGPTNVSVGDPITLKVQVSGQGTLDSIALPSFSDWREFKTYPPTSKVETTDPLGLEGVKRFEFVVAPQNAEVKQVPPILFAYFDPQQGTYRTLSHPAIPISVQPASGPAPQPTVLGGSPLDKSAPAMTRDIVHIKNRLGSLTAVEPPWALQPWFWALLGAPFLIWLSAVVWRRRNDQWAANPRWRRQREVARFIRSGLVDLKRQAEANQKDEFFALVFRLLQERLGEQLDLPATAITEAVIDDQLRPREVPEETLAPCQELFQDCNQARYGQQYSTQALTALVPRLEAVLRALQKIPRQELQNGASVSKPA